MTEIFALTAGDPRWEAAAAFADGSAWRAGPYLAREMRAGHFHDWERVFVAYAEGAIAGYCVFAEKDELPEAYGLSPFIGFVYVDPLHRGHRLSQALLDSAVRYAGKCGFDRVYLMSGEKGLYEKYGFIGLGEYPNVWGTADQLFYRETGGTLAC